MSPPRVHTAEFTLKRVQEMLGLSRYALQQLIAAGVVTPARGPRNRHRFSFKDLVLLRTAHRLRRAHIAPRTILRTLERLRTELPAELPLSGLRIAAMGNQVVLRDRMGPREVVSGQRLLDFDALVHATDIAAIVPKPMTSSRRAWFERGVTREATDPEAAADAYRRAIDAAPHHVDAYLNLGALWCESQRSASAVTLYERALAQGIEEARLYFNYAIALEDIGRLADALVSYRRAIELDPHFFDAHHNLACLLEQCGDTRAALRHLKVCRQLQRSDA